MSFMIQGRTKSRRMIPIKISGEELRLSRFWVYLFNKYNKIEISNEEKFFLANLTDVLKTFDGEKVKQFSGKQTRPEIRLSKETTDAFKNYAAANNLNDILQRICERTTSDGKT